MVEVTTIVAGFGYTTAASIQATAEAVSVAVLWPERLFGTQITVCRGASSLKHLCSHVSRIQACREATRDMM